MLLCFLHFITLVLANDIILVERDCKVKPNDVCANECRKCVSATKENLPGLVSQLKLRNISQAAVCGYNGILGNFAVKKDGNVECYGDDDDDIHYVFCYADYKPPVCRTKECEPVSCCSSSGKLFPCWPPSFNSSSCWKPSLKPSSCWKPPFRPSSCWQPPFRPSSCSSFSSCSKLWRPDHHRPQCPTFRFRKCCVDRCGRVTKRISGCISCYKPRRHHGYDYDHDYD